MEVWQAVILGVVEGLTEFLPVSSTGHMVLVAHVMGIAKIEFVKTFEIAVQLGAIAAVAVSYAQAVIKNRRLVVKIALTCLPTGLVGVLAYEWVKGVLLESPAVTVGGLVGGGVVIILWEKAVLRRGRSGGDLLTVPTLSNGKCLVLGFIQALAIVPGVSRSAATIIGGMGLGLSRREATEFSFVAAVPVLFLASGWDLANTGFIFSRHEYALLATGFLVSMAVAWLVVRVLMNYLKRHTFEVFGWYRIGLGLVYGLVFLA